MSAVLLRPDGVRAVTCSVYLTEHRPEPLRFIWHHLLPEVCGGATDNVNLIEACDGCHMAIHALLWLMKVKGPTVDMTGLASLGARKYARKGYLLAVANGTVHLIPNEGSILGWAA